MVEDFTQENEDYEGSKLSMQGKIKKLEYEEQKKKIEGMRKSHEKWLKPGSLPKENAEPNSKNLDIVLFSMKPENEITLSVYNKKETFFRTRPNTAPMAGQFERLPGQALPLKPVPEEGEGDLETYVAPERIKLPEFKDQMHLVERSAAEAYKQEQLREIEMIKQAMSQDGCPQNIGALQKAIMMPELKEFDIGKRMHPTTKMYLMANPFPKKKKKKKKKGKKKKK